MQSMTVKTKVIESSGCSFSLEDESELVIISESKTLGGRHRQALSAHRVRELNLPDDFDKSLKQRICTVNRRMLESHIMHPHIQQGNA